jgi:hypothetical protein
MDVGFLLMAGKAVAIGNRRMCILVLNDSRMTCGRRTSISGNGMTHSNRNRCQQKNK